MIDETRLQSVLEDLLFSHPQEQAICKPGINLRPDGEEWLVAYMVDEGGEAHDLGRFPRSWITLE